MNEEQWGRLQEGNPQRESRSGKYIHKCDGCGQQYWSDEAANLHYIGDCMVRLANVLAKAIDKGA